MTDVGAYEAKTHLPQLLQLVEAGETITITRHGRAVAQLVPVRQGAAPPQDVVTALRDARRGVRRGDDAVRTMIDEGRR